MIYLMRPFKQAAWEVGIWTEDSCDMKRVNSFYTMVYWGLNYKINKRIDSLSW